MRFMSFKHTTDTASSLSLPVAAAFALLVLTCGVVTAVSAQTGAKTQKPKALKVSPKKLSFGDLPPLKPSAPETATIHNPNSIAVDISSIGSSDPEFVPSVNCVGSLAVGGSCVVSVVFTASSDGKKSAKLTIVNNASAKALSVKMSGEGIGTPVPSPTATPTATTTPTPTATATGATPTATPTASPLAQCSPLPVKTTSALWVSDSTNSRVLEYLPPFTTGMSASLVLGQPNFTTANHEKNASGMDRPEMVAFDNAGNLWSSDYQFVRVLEFLPPFITQQNASKVIGEPNFTTFSYGTGVNASILDGGPVGIAFDQACNLWTADRFNNRVLEFVKPLTTGMSASLVLGQPNLTSGGKGSGANQLNGLQEITFDGSGDLWVADYNNNRVVEFVPPFSDGQSASVILGENDSGNPKASTLSLPFGVSFDAGGNLWVADGGNNRTLEFVPPFSSGMSASVVLGQQDLNSNGPSSAADGEHSPDEVAFDDEGNMFLADAQNNRVLEYKPPFTTGMSASIAIGQPDLTSSTPNLTATGLDDPLGVSVQP